jgi:organic hydroperoxide reductase OsmC/OhrA
MEKSRAKPKDVSTDVDLIMERNQRGRWRVKGIKVRLKPQVEDVDAKKLERCKEMFQDFCIVSTSVREGIPIDVEVEKE